VRGVFASTSEDFSLPREREYAQTPHPATTYTSSSLSPSTGRGSNVHLVKRAHHEYEIDDDPARPDFARVYTWLTNSYWSPGITRERVELAAAGSSLVVGAYLDDVQVGYLRVVSDRATFAWIADVFVDPDHRGKQIANAMLRFALEHPEHQQLRRWILATRDAHEVYSQVGFIPLPHPERFMILKPADGL
jgi:GNAT superfamily N-acetyltransferase